MEALLHGMQKKKMMGTLFGSCEAELQELMRQIDIMLEHKKSEWEAHTETLNTLLQLRDQELSAARTREERLSQEIRSLRKQLTEQEENNRSKTAEYESQLARFQDELNKLKKTYERVQRRHQRMEMKSSGEEDRSEVSRLARRLEEFRQKSLDWEKQRLLYQQQVAALEAQRRTLAEQTEKYQEQSQSRKHMLEQTSLAGRSELQHISGQLVRANDSLYAKEEELESLKLQLETATTGRERAERELEQARQTMKVLQEEKAELRATIQAHTDFLEGSKAQKEELHREVLRVSDLLRDKENSIRSLEERLKLTKLSDGHTEIEVLRSQLSISRLNEQRLQEEVTRLEDHVRSVTLQSQQFTQEIKGMAESRHLLEEEHKKCWTEIKKLRSQLTQAELSYSSVLDGMKKEISQLTQELHQKDIGIASKDWERKLQAERERADREAAEHKVLLAAVKTLREENRQLTGMLEKQEPDVRLALDNLECENQRLQKELSQARRNLELVLHTRQSDLHSAVEGRTQELLGRHEEELKALNERLSEVSQRYEELQRSVHANQKAAGVLQGLSRTGSRESVSSEPFQVDDGDAEDSHQVAQFPLPPSTPPNTIASRFLQEEELRSQDLIQRLDSHIEELKQESQQTVQHFTKLR
ncbi:centrosomal protein of 63 kDa isoform X1 [Bufo gargarizans]|uniref:centrosomal protein of 63 kDa isoform X1 n=1 Tax=Bufo gargarizans TaxID=30331 RepID=UPI001CF0DE4D|nr:centrosomal protein of 63 kDa isoform X1 [Bufo gargarizans]XP_044147509.1 centrosomal protein of 63 kDa isoform X1 [Bufo gargarizans]